MGRTPENGWLMKFVDQDKHDFKRRIVAYHKYLKNELHVDEFSSVGDLVIDLLCRPKNDANPDDSGGALTILDGGAPIDRSEP